MDTPDKPSQTRTYSAFAGHRLLATGTLQSVLPRAMEHARSGASEALLVFEDWSGRQVDFDLRGTVEEALERADPSPQTGGRGRPRLGVVSREVSLLPAHWDWLEAQPNGASAALRRLVEEARRRNPAEDRARLALTAAGRFTWAMAGDLPGFEEASRALYARDRASFEERTLDWPADVRAAALRLAGPCFAAAGSPGASAAAGR